MDHRYIHDVTLKAEHKHHSGWELGANLHLIYMQPSKYVKMALAGIDKVSADNGFTNPDGTEFPN